MAYGRYFEELNAGEHFQHWPGRTINDYDDTLLSLLSMNRHPVHHDEHFARVNQHGRRLVAGPTAISIVFGLTQGRYRGTRARNLELFQHPARWPSLSWRHDLRGVNYRGKMRLPGWPWCGDRRHEGESTEEIILTLERQTVVPKGGLAACKP